MNKLVFQKNNGIFTDSLIIAEGTKNKHRSVQRIIDKYNSSIEQFGKVRFEITPSKSGQSQKVYLLNEQQATFLITLLKNTDKVVNFKLELVKQFYEMRKLLLERQTTDWIETRHQGKLTRRSETDVIKKLIEYAKQQGSKNSQMLYLTYTKLANKIIGINGRDNASIMQLNTLSLAEHIILNCIQQGMTENLHYKDIYRNSKKRLEAFKDISYLEPKKMIS